MNSLRIEEANELLSATIVSLRKTKPFFSRFGLIMIRQECKDIPTLGVTADWHLLYNPDFIKKIYKEKGKKGLEYIVCHEIMHYVLMTLTRIGKRNMPIWNIATDLKINEILDCDFGRDCMRGEGLHCDANGTFAIPGTKKFVEVKDKLAEEVYDQLMEKMPKGPGGGKGKNKKEKGKGGGGGGGNSKDDQGDDDDGRGGGIEEWDKHIYGKAEKDKDGNPTGQGGGKPLSEGEKSQLEQDIKNKIQEALISAKNRGTMNGELERILEKLLEPKIDWRNVLKRFVSARIPHDYTMVKPGIKYFATKVYMPSVKKEGAYIFVAVDVSGSIGSKIFERFASEMFGMLAAYRNLKMRIVFWSTYIDPKEDLIIEPWNMKKAKDIFNPKNSGGTNMSCVKEYMDNDRKIKDFDAFVYLTDGCIESNPKVYGDPRRTLFVLPKGGSPEIVAKYGAVVKIEEDE